MELKSVLKQLKESKEFTVINKKNPDIFFSYAFKMLEGNKEQLWQLGFYHKSTDKVITFVVKENTIEILEEESIFKKPDTEVKPIEIKKVKISFENILKATEEFRKKKYPNELTNKTIVILQNLHDYGTIWNITFITYSFNTLNIKINVENGKIVHHSISPLMNFIKK